MRWSLVPVSSENVRCLVWVHEGLLPPDEPDHADGATITTSPSKARSDEMRHAGVRVTEVLPRPMCRATASWPGGCIEVHRALLVREQLRG